MRFIVCPLAFRDWPFNPNWALFQGNRGASPDGDSSEEIDKNVRKREILCVKQSMDFYLKDVDASGENVALKRRNRWYLSAPSYRHHLR